MSMPAAPKPAGVRSPCSSVCKLSTVTQWCEGCFRTIDEITAWSTMSDPQRLEVWRLLRARRLQARTAALPKP